MQANRFPSDSDDRLPIGPFLGRRPELERLCRAVEEARCGRGARLWIVGPTGIGKTRMLAEIVQYAAWRHVPVDNANAADLRDDSDRREFRFEPSVLIVDPVEVSQVAELDERLCRASEKSTLALATLASAESCSSAGVPKAALITLGRLDPEDSLRLLEACLGPAFDPVSARRSVVSAGGRPGEMRRAAARFLETRRRQGERLNASPSER
jgi:hypothetical protein